MARLGAGLGMRVIAWIRRAAPERAVHGLVFVPLSLLFAEADVVSLHLSYRPETQGIITRALLDRMKRSAWFVNTARAKLVDNVALVEMLAANRIAGTAFHAGSGGACEMVVYRIPLALPWCKVWLRQRLGGLPLSQAAPYLCRS
jgi:hypothetical protein